MELLQELNAKRLERDSNWTTNEVVQVIKYEHSEYVDNHAEDLPLHWRFKTAAGLSRVQYADIWGIRGVDDEMLADAIVELSQDNYVIRGISGLPTKEVVKAKLEANRKAFYNRPRMAKIVDKMTISKAGRNGAVKVDLGNLF